MRGAVSPVSGSEAGMAEFAKKHFRYGGEMKSVIVDYVQMDWVHMTCHN